jgi:hypothetical protein
MKWVTVTTAKVLVTITQRGVMIDLIIYTVRNTGSLQSRGTFSLLSTMQRKHLNDFRFERLL